jgi:hypothetical protein
MGRARFTRIKRNNTNAHITESIAWVTMVVWHGSGRCCPVLVIVLVSSVWDRAAVQAGLAEKTPVWKRVIKWDLRINHLD